MEFHINGISLTDLFVMLVTGGAIYGAIRTDIKNIHEKISRTEKNIDAAHERIDKIYEKGLKV
jgi:hypothetical protein